MKLNFLMVTTIKIYFIEQTQIGVESNKVYFIQEYYFENFESWRICGKK